jgi:hypothetical protein
MLKRLWPFRTPPFRTPPPTRRYAFIVTYGRSGSSVLQSMLAGITGAHITGENADALAGLFASYRAAFKARRKQGTTARDPPGDPWRGAHRIDPEAYNRALADAFVRHVLAVPPAATLVGFKEVRYFDHDDLEEYLDYIRLTFAPALLIFNRRKPEAVAASGWWKNHPADIAAEVRAFDARTDAYAAHHPDSCIVADYDAYVADPQVLAPLFERLGAEFNLAQVERVLATRLDH